MHRWSGSFQYVLLRTLHFGEIFSPGLFVSCLQWPPPRITRNPTKPTAQVLPSDKKLYLCLVFQWRIQYDVRFVTNQHVSHLDYLDTI
jgi:hypothetical protein